MQGNIIRDTRGDAIRIDGAMGNLIGGSHAGLGNQVFQNTGDGIQILTAGASGNLVQYNTVGTDRGGGSIINGQPSGNGGDGILIDGASGNLVGGDSIPVGPRRPPRHLHLT